MTEATSALHQPMAAGHHRAADLIELFDALFARRHGVRLRGGAVEPLYEPPGPGRPGHIWFRADYFASALHEVAHWCIAGARRRRLPDYGYWYAPDGRGAAEQRAFEQVEVAPQALESLFADAARSPFRVSLDNLHGTRDPDEAGRATVVFEAALAAERRRLLQIGLPPRAAVFRAALARRYGGGTDCAGSP